MARARVVPRDDSHDGDEHSMSFDFEPVADGQAGDDEGDDSDAPAAAVHDEEVDDMDEGDLDDEDIQDQLALEWDKSSLQQTNGHRYERRKPTTNGSTERRSPMKEQIEIVIRPLPENRRNQYKLLPPSDYVTAILGKAGSPPHEGIYNVEFEDGRLDQVAFDDLFNLPNGQRALHTFKKMGSFRDEDQEMGFSNMLRKRKVRHDSDYESEHSEMDVDDPIQHWNGDEDDDEDDDDDEDNDEDQLGMMRLGKRRHLRPSSTRVAAVSSRRSTRQSSRLPSTEDEDTRGQPTRRHLLRSRPETRTSTQNKSVAFSAPSRDEDADELGAGAGEDSDEFFPVVRSDLQPGGRRSRKKRRGRPPANPRRSRDSSIEFEPNRRRSSRANKNTKSMADALLLDEDSFYVEDDKSPVVPKIINMKEVFQTLEESDFKHVHSQICDTCHTGQEKVSVKGPLIYCQGCSLCFHRSCIGYRSAREHMVTKVGPEYFVLQCRLCIGLNRTKDRHAPRHNMCQVCREPGPACKAFSDKKTPKQEEKLRKENDGVDPVTTVDPALIDGAKNVLFRCMTCRRGFHFEHLPPPSKDWVDPDESDIRTERLAEYSIDWKCRDCIDINDKVEGLVAWRPSNQETYQLGKKYDDMDEDDKEYLVKWELKSHAHCTWMPGAWVVGIAHSRMRTSFSKRNDGADQLPCFEAKDAIPEEYLLADVILAVRYRNPKVTPSKTADMERIDDLSEIRVKFQGLGYDQAVWDAPPPRDSGSRWETFKSAYYEYLNGKHFRNEQPGRMETRVAEFKSQAEFEELKEQPPGLKKGTLMNYQIQGMNWIIYNYYLGRSVVLADEMGLGKTIQVIAFITYLVQQRPRCWPFLIVVPNSTCPNWRREIKSWAPDLRVVTYHGGKVPQKLAYDHELFPNGSRDMKAHVVVMSYDSAQDDETRRLFKSVYWAGLVVDEGQRLKNDENILYGALKAMRIDFRLLLTGTPLQNNKRELFNLLQFIDSSKNAAQLDAKYEEITAENLPELHELIRPYFLRRTKAEVLKFLPAMGQIIIPVSMTVVQEKLCKSIMSKNPDLIRAIFAKGKMKATERGSLNNILMQLRKCLCHPFIYSEAIEERTVDPDTLYRNLIDASSKLQLLEIMLPKLKERGHRVLIFSQFLNQLDIIEDFLVGQGFRYQRLDGNISSLVKQKRIDQFNEPDSPLFAFLLSTRAGGVGINLATADTVIILDPDFNPHQDIQALSRAHRIGQKKKVLCFQLMTKDSVEEKIMQIGRKKMALDHALIESMDMADDAGNDLESILKHGAEALFSETAQKDTITYDAASVDKLLDRSQIENTKTDENRSAESQFSFARVWANDKGALTDDIEVAEEQSDVANLNMWDDIIKEREEEARRIAEANKEVLGRGGRRRQAVKYNVAKYDVFEDGQNEAIAPVSDSDEDDDYNNPKEEESGEESETEGKKAQDLEPNHVLQRPSSIPPPPANKVPRPRGRPRLNPIPSRPQPQPSPSSNFISATPSSIGAAANGAQRADVLPGFRDGQWGAQQPQQHPFNPQNAKPTQARPQPNGQLGAPQTVRSNGLVVPVQGGGLRPAAAQEDSRIPDLQKLVPGAGAGAGAAAAAQIPCKNCGLYHFSFANCLHLNSERDVRLALDILRKAPAYLENREVLVGKLRDLAQSGNRKSS